MLKTRSLIAPALAALALFAAGCGSSTKESPADKYAQQAEQEAATAPKTVPQAAPVKVTVVKPSSGEADLSKKPTVPKGSGAAPSSLQAQDLIVGKGPAAKDGDKLTVQYVGVLYKNGKEFDTSWGKQPFTFPLGQGQVIQGWDQGLVGMKVGGRRKLIVPAALAYGATGSPPKIGPNEPLIFDVDLKKIA